jgi:hypothetical protein
MNETTKKLKFSSKNDKKEIFDETHASQKECR